MTETAIKSRSLCNLFGGRVAPLIEISLSAEDRLNFQ